MTWAVQSSLYQHKSLRKEDSGTVYEQKADWKWHEDKLIKRNQNKTDWMKNAIKVDLTKSFSDCACRIKNFNFERKVCEILKSS